MAIEERSGWAASENEVANTVRNAIVDDAEQVEEEADDEPEEQITASKLRDASRKEMDATRLYLKEIDINTDLPISFVYHLDL